MAPWVIASSAFKADGSANTISRSARRFRLLSGSRSSLAETLEHLLEHGAARAQHLAADLVEVDDGRSQALENTGRRCSCRWQRHRSARPAHGLSMVSGRRGRRYRCDHCGPHIIASQPAAARNGPNGIGTVRPCRPRQDQHHADQRADGRRGQDDRQQHLPAEPRAECAKQFEIPVAHAFLAGEPAEHLIDAPKTQVAAGRAEHRRSRCHRHRRARCRVPARCSPARPSHSSGSVSESGSS